MTTLGCGILSPLRMTTGGVGGFSLTVGGFGAVFAEVVAVEEGLGDSLAVSF
jgi:hypothetical protein